MRIRRTLPVVLAVALIAAAVTLAVQLRKHAPPEAARLLPGADAFFYVDLRWARKANAGKDLPPVIREPEYENFVRDTGFEFERDLEEAAFAVEYPGARIGAGHTGMEARFSEVLVGKFDGNKIAAYLKNRAHSVENYESIEIYSIPIEDRVLRVALLNVDSVAASNVEDPAVIHGMVDRSRRLASPFGGPALLRRYYKYVQLSSPIWLVAHIEPSLPEFNGWSNLLPRSTDLVLSASYNPLHLPGHPGAVHFRADAFALSAEDAHAIAEKLNVFLSLTHSAETSIGAEGTDADVKALFESIKIKEDGDRAILTASVPVGFLHKALSGSPPELVAPPTPTPAPQRSH